MKINIYYKIWSDCIRKIQTHPNNRKEWRLYTMTFMSFLMSINFIFIMALIQNDFFGIPYFYKLETDIFKNKELNALISFLVLFFLPPLVINYFLILRKDRYKLFLNNYPNKNGQLFFKYMLISLVVPIIILLLAIIR